MIKNNRQVSETIAEVLVQLEPAFVIYDAYLLFKIDQAVCCELFSVLAQKLDQVPELVRSKSKQLTMGDTTNLSDDQVEKLKTELFRLHDYLERLDLRHTKTYSGLSDWLYPMKK